MPRSAVAVPMMASMHGWKPTDSTGPHRRVIRHTDGSTTSVEAGKLSIVKEVARKSEHFPFGVSGIDDSKRCPASAAFEYGPSSSRAPVVGRSDPHKSSAWDALPPPTTGFGNRQEEWAVHGRCADARRREIRRSREGNMFSRWVRLGTAVAAIATVAPSTAQADPIRALYRVEVFARCTCANNSETCSEFHTSFPVTLTFDSETLIDRGDDSDRTRFYGSPTVSDIPLALRDDFPPLHETLRQAAERAQFLPDDHGWRRESGVAIRFGASVDFNDFHRDLAFDANGVFPFVPELNAASFARFLGEAPFRQFSVADSIELASGGFELLSYRGKPTIESVTATPEPASLLLTATGILCFSRRRPRGRRQFRLLSGI